MDRQVFELNRQYARQRALKRAIAMLCVFVMLFTVNSLKMVAQTLSRVPMCGLKSHQHKAKCYDDSGALICGKQAHRHTDACYQESPTIEVDLADDLVLDQGVSADNLALDLDAGDLLLDDGQVAPVPAAEENKDSETPSYSLGSKALLSRIIRETGLKVRLKKIREVGIVDNDSSQAGLVEIKKLKGGDYRIVALHDFAQVDLALVLADEVVLVKLVDGVGAASGTSAKKGEDAPEQTEVGGLASNQTEAEQPEPTEQPAGPVEAATAVAVAEVEQPEQPSDEPLVMEEQPPIEEQTEAVVVEKQQSEQPMEQGQDEQPAAPIEEETQEEQSTVEDAQVEEVAPAVEDAQDEEVAPAVEDAQVEEAAPAVEDAQVEEAAPAVEDAQDGQPVDEQTVPTVEDRLAAVEDVPGEELVAQDAGVEPPVEEEAQAEQTAEDQIDAADIELDVHAEEVTTPAGEVPAAVEEGIDPAGETSAPAEEQQSEEEAAPVDGEDESTQLEEMPLGEEAQGEDKQAGGAGAEAEPTEIEVEGAEEEQDEAEQPEATFAAGSRMIEVNDSVVTLSWPGEAHIPDDVVIAISEIEMGSPEYDLLYYQALAELPEPEQAVTQVMRFFDITLYTSDGVKIEPDAPVNVVVSVNETVDGSVNALHCEEVGAPMEAVEANAEGEGVAFDAPSFSVYGVNYSKPAEEAAVNNEVRVDLSSVDTMAAATVEGKGVTLSISDLLEGRDEAVQSDVDGQVDTQAFAREAKVAASADVRVADGQITLSAGAMERATVSLQMETTDISDDYITTVTTHTVDIVLSDYAGRTGETVGEGVTVTALGENSLPADAKASVAENVEVPQSVEVAENESAAAFDINLTNGNGDAITGPVAVTVMPSELNVLADLPEGATATGVRYTLIHVRDDGSTETVDLPESAVVVDENGNVRSFSFETEGFSTYVLKYTVDFEYTDPTTGEAFAWSWDGRGSYPVASIMAQIGVAGEISDVSLARTVDAGGPENALYLEEKEDVWYLTSEEAFEDTFELTVVVDGAPCVIVVTDEQVPHTTDLNALLTDIDITNNSDESVIQSGKKIVVDLTQTYDFAFTFQENPGLQFNNDSTLVYIVPEGVDLQTMAPQPFTIDVGGRMVTGNTYQVVEVDGHKEIHIDFNRSHINYPFLAAARDTRIQLDFAGRITQEFTTNNLNFGAEAQGYSVENKKECNAKVRKEGQYDAASRQMRYRVYVTATKGNPTDVNVKDTITGTALTFGRISYIGEYSDENGNQKVRDLYTGSANPGNIAFAENQGTGFDLTIPSVPEGHTVKIEYTADVDLTRIALNNNATVQETGNGVTISAEGDDTPDDDESRHEEKYINFSSIAKNASAVGEIVDGNGNAWVEGVSTGKKYRIVSWKVTANTEGIVSLKGSAITDALLQNGDKVEYYGNGITVKKAAASGTAINWAGIPGTEVAWADVGVSDKANAGGWSYPLTDDGKYAYEITYQTRVDISSLPANSSMELVNAARSRYDEDTARITVKTNPETVPSVTKNATSVSQGYTTWKISVDIPAGWTGPLVVDDTLPHMSVYYDEIASVVVDGYTEGSVPGNGYYTKEIIKPAAIYIDGKLTVPDGDAGLKLDFGTIAKSNSNRTISITVVTRNNQEWIAYSNTEGGKWTLNHENKAKITDGGNHAYGENSDTVQPLPGSLTKTSSEGAPFDYWHGNDAYNNPIMVGGGYIYPFYVRISGVTTPNVDIRETFDTEFFEVYMPDEGHNRYNSYTDALKIYYNDTPYNIGQAADHPATVEATDTGAILHLTNLTRTAGNAFYGFYTVRYYLILKEDKIDDFRDYVAKHGTPVVDGNGNVTGKVYTFNNNADWNGLRDSEGFSYSISNVIDKQYAIDNDGNYHYTITLNPDKLKVNDGRKYELSDVFSGVTVARNTISVTTDPDGKTVGIYGTASEAISATEDIVIIHDPDGSISAMVPDQTKIVLQYQGVPTGVATVDEEKKKAVTHVTNEASALEYHYQVDYTREHDVIKKKMEKQEDGSCTFTIDLNPDKVLLKGGEDYTVTDTFTGLKMDDDSFTVTVCEPDEPDHSKAASILASKALTSTTESSGTYTFTIPDGTHVTIVYTGRPVYAIDGETGDITASFVNTATADNIPSEVPGQVEDNVLTKTAGSLNTNNESADYGFIPFTIVFNPTAEELNEGKDIEMKDAFTNLIVEYSSVHITPAFYPSWHPEQGQPIAFNYSGNEGTFMVPDKTKITLTYKAKPDFSKGDSVAWSNRVTCKGYTSQTGRTEEMTTSGAGSASLAHSLYLFKYESGHMERPMNGVTFKLYMDDGTGAKRPVLTAGGEQVAFTTENLSGKGKGYQLMLLGDDIQSEFVDAQKGGFKPDAIYFLVEDGTVEGYYPNETEYNFVWHSNTKQVDDPENPGHKIIVANEPYTKPAYMTGKTVYVFGDRETVKVTNERITRDVSVHKYWVNSDGTWNWPQEIDRVTVKLQRRVGEGDWEDVSEENNTVPSYYWNAETNAVVEGADGTAWQDRLELSKYETHGTWYNLDPTVKVDWVDTEVAYRAVEVSLTSGGTTEAVVDGRVTIHGHTYEVMGGAVNRGTASLTNGEITAVRFEKRWSMPQTITFVAPEGAVPGDGYTLNDGKLTVDRSNLTMKARLHRYYYKGGDKLADEDFAETDPGVVVALSGSNWTHEWADLPTASLDDTGRELDYVYEVEEVSVTLPASILHDGSGNPVDIREVFNATASRNENGDYILTNTLKDDDNYYLNVEKAWLDADGNPTAGDRPIEFRLLRDSETETIGGGDTEDGKPATIELYEAYSKEPLTQFEAMEYYTNADRIQVGDTVAVTWSNGWAGNANVTNWEGVKNRTSITNGWKITITARTVKMYLQANDGTVFKAEREKKYEPAVIHSSATGESLAPNDPSDYSKGFHVEDYTYTLQPGETLSFPNLPGKVTEGNSTTAYVYRVEEITTGDDFERLRVDYSDGSCYNPATAEPGKAGSNGTATMVNRYNFTYDHTAPALNLKKVDQYGQALSGITFGLYDGSTEIARGSTDTAGALALSIPKANVTSGFGEKTFVLKELQVPEGYTSQGPWTVAVSSTPEDMTRSGSTRVYHWKITGVKDKNEAAAELDAGAYTIVNTRRLGSLRLTKRVRVNGSAPTSDTCGWVDGEYTFAIASGQGVSPAVTRTVVITVANSAVASATVDESDALLDNDGYVVISDLPEGDYTITETAVSDMTTTVSGGRDNLAGSAAGTITVHVTAGQDAPAAAATATFTNNRPCTTQTLAANKILNGEAFNGRNGANQEIHFSFTLKPVTVGGTAGNPTYTVDDHALQTRQTDGTGAVTFDPIAYTLEDMEGATPVSGSATQTEKTFTYALQEVLPEGANADNNYSVGGVRYDPAVYTVAVKLIYDSGRGTLSVAQGYPTYTKVVNGYPITTTEPASFGNEEVVDISVAKAWGEGSWPEEVNKVKVGLYRVTGSTPETIEAIQNGQEPMTAELTGGQPDAIFANLPKYENGQPITYRVREIEAEVSTKIGDQIHWETYTELSAPSVTDVFDIDYTDPAAGNHYTATVRNTLRETGIDVQKVVQGTGTPLSGAEFTLEKKIDNLYQVMGSKESGADGKLSFTGLRAGHYRLEETHIPNGYLRTSAGKYIYFVVDADGVTWIGDEAEAIPTTDNGGTVTYTAANEDDPATFTVGNAPGAALPATGGTGTAPIYIGGGAMVLLALALLIRRRRNCD